MKEFGNDIIHFKLEIQTYQIQGVGGGCAAAANPLTTRGFIRERLGLGLWCEGLTGLTRAAAQIRTLTGS